MARLEKTNKHKVESSSPTKEELELINSYTRREYTQQELYTFSVVLCDNDIDRDYEAFSVNALKQMAGLFVGKTGISDHNPTAQNQTARIYSCNVEYVQGRKTLYGEPYCKLTAKAYIPVLPSTQETIQLIESGIKKEVSVGCSADRVLCSVCGADVHTAQCGHYKGKQNGDICYHIIDNVTDAYEWSFVAVPSQKNAGVIKSYYKEGNMSNIIEEVKKGNYSVINNGNANEIGKYIKELQQLAEYGAQYRKELEDEYVRFSSLCLDCSSSVLRSVAKKLKVQELVQLKTLYKNAVEGGSFLKPQLVKSEEVPTANDKQYNI